MIYNDWLSRRNIYTPHKEAIYDLASGIRLTYSELNTRANRLAFYLQKEYGIKPGDRIAAVAKNCINYIDLFFASGKIGSIIVPLNFRLPAPAIAELILDCEPSLLVYGTEYSEMATDFVKNGYVNRKLALTNQENSIYEIIGRDFPLPKIFEADIEDTAMILYTSGTTGKSKGAMIPWRQIHWNAINTSIGLSITRDDCTIVNTPFYHTGGWHVLLMPVFHNGGKIILQPEFNPEECNMLMEQEKVTILFGIPTMLRMMMEKPNFDTLNFSSVRFAICGGEACPIPVIQRYKERNIPIRQGYGLTEAGPNCYSLPAEDAIRKQGSVGFPNFHVAVRIADDNGQELPPGEVGELLMKGPHTFSGYWRNEEATKNTINGGWVKTGDLFKCDEDGYYFLIGRKKEMYISGGENVYPVQLEKVIYAFEGVAQTAVIGVEDEKWGEAGCAFIVPMPGISIQKEDIKAHCRKFLAGFQCPKYFLFVDALPIGHSNKIQKRDLYAVFEKAKAEGNV